jgi:hypothetical protein
MPKLVIFNINNDFVELESINYIYQIKNIKDWIFLINCSKVELNISYPDDFVKIPVDKNFLNNQSFELINDLDFKNEEIKPWNEFSGNLEGNNKTISNVSITNDTFNGLFGLCNKSNISNLNLSNISVQGGTYSGILIGYSHEVKLENINISGKIRIDGKHCGIVSGFFRGDINKLSIDISCNIPIINKFLGCLRNSVICTFSDENSILISNIFNGFINNCIFYNDNKIKLFMENNDGKITNSQFITLANDEINDNYLENAKEIIKNNINNKTTNELDLQNIWIN